MYFKYARLTSCRTPQVKGSERVPRSFIRDESRSLGVCLQELASNRLGVAVVKSHGDERQRKRAR